MGNGDNNDSLTIMSGGSTIQFQVNMLDRTLEARIGGSGGWCMVSATLPNAVQPWVSLGTKAKAITLSDTVLCCVSSEEMHADLARDLQVFYDSGIMCDVTVVAGGTRIPAHSV